MQKFFRFLTTQFFFAILFAAALFAQASFIERPYLNYAGAWDINIEDIDQDGALDIAACSNSNKISCWRNDGNLNFTEHIIRENFDGVRSVRADDGNGDGEIDIIAAAWVANTIAWWENEFYSFKFTADVTTGHAPLQVKFIDLSNARQPMTAWAWDFDNDGSIDANQRQPEWTFQSPGTYSVRLVVSNNSLSQTMVKKNFIRVFDGESALLFDGDKSKVTCSASAGLNLRDKLTIEAKIDPAGWGKVMNIGFGRIIDKKSIVLYLIGASPTFNDHCLALQLTHADGTASISTSPDNSIRLDTWQHVAISYDANASEVKMYINSLMLYQTTASDDQSESPHSHCPKTGKSDSVRIKNQS